MVNVPVGPAAAKAYLWWFLIDRLRSVGGIAPQPNPADVPSFPQNGAMPVGWAKFVQNLMPFKDPDTQSVYQWKYTYTGIPAQTSPCLAPSVAYTDFGYGALGNFDLIPAPDVASAANNFTELAWILDNTAWSFATLTSTGYDEMSQWFSSSGNYVEAQWVSRVAPDASACAVAYGPGAPSPGVVCQSNYFDAEMAIILHPPITTVVQNLPVGLGLFGVYNTDFIQKPLPAMSVQTPGPVNANVNLAMSGLKELLINYGYITNRAFFSNGAKKSFLKEGVGLEYPGLKCYAPYYINLNLTAYHQATTAFLETLYFAPQNPPVGTAVTAANSYLDPCDYAIAKIWLESCLFARCISFAYPGVLVYTGQDFASNVNYGNDFATCPMPPILADMIETYAPTIKGGRLTVPIFNYVDIAATGLTYNAVVVNQVQSRWAQIGTNFATVGTNLNLFDPLNAVPATTHYLSQLFAFNEINIGFVASALLLRGFGNNAGANWSNFISLVSQSFTAPIPATPVVTARMGPAVPCRMASKFVGKVYEMFSNLTATWIVSEWSAMGGYTTQTVVNCRIEETPVVITTTTTNMNIRVVSTVIPTKLGAYYPYDKESAGRCFSYSCRYTPFENDQWPAVQSFSGNSAAVTQLINYTSAGGDSNYIRDVQSKRTAHEVSMIEAVRAVVGPIQFNQVIAFSGLRYTVPRAIMIITKSKKLLVTTPYHSPSSASLTSYNSPSLWDDFWGFIGDVGDRVASIGGHFVGGILGGGLMPGLQLASTNPPTLKAGKFTREMLKVQPRFVPAKILSSADELKKRQIAKKAADEAFNALNLNIPPVVAQLPQISLRSLLEKY
jgi:hypothetical protein